MRRRLGQRLGLGDVAQVGLGQALGRGRAAGAGLAAGSRFATLVPVGRRPAFAGRARRGRIDSQLPLDGQRLSDGATALAGAWLAYADADSRVPEDWLVRQLRHAREGADVLVGTVTVDVGKVVRSIKAGQVEFRVDKAGILHVPVGRASFDETRLEENITSLVEPVKRRRPSSAKGTYLKGVTISSTMGPGVSVDPAAFIH